MHFLLRKGGDRVQQYLASFSFCQQVSKGVDWPHELNVLSEPAVHVPRAGRQSTSSHCFELLHHMIHRLTRRSATVNDEGTYIYWTPLIAHRDTFVSFLEGFRKPPYPFPVGIGPAEFCLIPVLITRLEGSKAILTPVVSLLNLNEIARCRVTDPTKCIRRGFTIKPISSIEFQIVY